MFARQVSIHLKADVTAAFANTIEKEVLPALRKQQGFQDELTLVAPGGRDAVAISFWDNKENAEAYNKSAYPEMLKILGNVTDGPPQVRVFDVTNSTFHKIAASVAA
ncbi:MAG TPA: hypothetical protein VJT08_08090 [Terriglobales bacterium]|nr:hypothetical protein [Terriglobales bacterium]